MLSLNELETKIPPPLLTIIFVILMWLASSFSASIFIPDYLRIVLFVSLCITAFSVALLGVYSFRRAKTTVNPFNPDKASSLVCTGIYRYTRNPMYLGLFIGLAGWGIYLSSAIALVLPFIFVLTINRLQIIPEERALESIFRSRYVEYKTRVRRWI
jgi:protein-S-isoprenylcysteine O-methyltransferase Ste14